jgi:hypothetical protein
MANLLIQVRLLELRWLVAQLLALSASAERQPVFATPVKHPAAILLPSGLKVRLVVKTTIEVMPPASI